MPYMDTKSEDHSHFKDMKEDPKHKNMGDLEWFGHSRSSAMSQFYRVHTSFYSPFVETVCHVPF